MEEKVKLDIKKEEPKKKFKINKPKFIKLKSFLKKNKDTLNFFKEFTSISLIYGLVINYMLWGIFGIRFGIFTFPAYGIAFHFIKEEFPRIWVSFFPARSMQ